MPDFTDTATQAARDAGRAPDEVRALGFAEVCALAGIDPAPIVAGKAEAPAGFCYQVTRACVANLLQAEIDQADREAAEGALAQAVVEIAAERGLTLAATAAIMAKPEAIPSVLQKAEAVKAASPVEEVLP